MNMPFVTHISDATLVAILAVYDKIAVDHVSDDVDRANVAKAILDTGAFGHADTIDEWAAEIVRQLKGGDREVDDNAEHRLGKHELGLR